MSTKKVTVNPYLSFPGKCREAMEYYREALGGELELMTFNEAPMDVPPEAKDNILHSTLRFGNAVIMGSDNMPGDEIIYGNGNTISIASQDVEEGRRFFENLSVDGKVLMPYDKTFWGAMFGMCIDKFGVSWMVNVELNSGQN